MIIFQCNSVLFIFLFSFKIHLLPGIERISTDSDAFREFSTTVEFLGLPEHRFRFVHAIRVRNLCFNRWPPRNSQRRGRVNKTFQLFIDPAR